MGLFKFLLGLKDIHVTGNMHVSSLQEQFAENFGTQLRIYAKTKSGSINTGKGSKPAKGNSTLASNSLENVKIKPMVIKKSLTVGDIEKQFEKCIGVGVQIASPDGKKLAPNDVKLKDVAKSMGG